jgi:hypothetical protein
MGPMDELIELITCVISPDTWEDVGGPGSRKNFGRLLVISQTLDVHLEIEALLEQIRADRRAVQTMVVDARWLLLDSELLAELLPPEKSRREGPAAIAVDPKTLDRIARGVPGYRGRITCTSGQTVHLVSGDRRSVVEGVGPVPAFGGSTRYQPVIEIPNVGVLLEVRATVVPDTATAALDVKSTVTRWRKPQQSVRIYSDDLPGQTGGGPGKTPQQPGGAPSIDVDCVRMPAQQFAAALRAPLGKPVLVGGLTLSPVTKARGKYGDQERKQLYLIVQTSLAADGS